MAWTKKTWLQRIVENAGYRLLTPTETPNVSKITRAEGVVTQEGDGFTVANMNDLETRIDSGFTDVNTKTGTLSNLTTSIKTSLVNAINELVTNGTKPKQAPTGTKIVVATSLTVGNTFTAPSNGIYQIRASFSTIAGAISGTVSNGEQFQVNAAATPSYGTQTRIPVNTGQVVTVSLVNLISTVEVAFSPMV